MTEGTAASFTLSRTGSTDAALTVAVAVSESGASVSGTPPTSVTFAAESSTATLSVATEDDEVSEDSSTLTVTVSSGTGYTVSGTSGSANVVVNDDDAPPVVATASPIVVVENATAVATLAATDADTDAADLSWSIPEGADGGADASKFALTAAGELTFKAAKDYESPDDADTDGDYEVTVRVTDGANPVDAALVVRLTDVDDAAPVVATASPIVVVENATAVATLAATDADTVAADLSWSIPEGADGGADASKFALKAAGELTFKAAKDYESPDDADTDGDYEVTVRVTDGANPVDAALVVRLTDVNEEAPTLSSASVDGDELTLTFSEALDELSTPPASSFAVTVWGAARTVASVWVSGSAVILTLPSAVTSDEPVTVGYTVPTGEGAKPIKDTEGNAAAAFANSEVTNRTSARPGVGQNTCGDTGDHASRCNDSWGVMITVSDADTTEGQGAELDFVVTLSHAHPLFAVTMDYEIEEGTHTGAATAGTDYTDTSGTLTFAQGETTKTISVAVLNDTVSEGVETLYLRLTNASGATFVRYGQAQPSFSAKGTILPDEDTTAPTVIITTEATSPVNGWFWVFINFSEPVKGLEPSDVEITNGTLEEFQTRYRFNEHGMREWWAKAVPTPGLNGNVTVKVPAGAVTDSLGNENTASNTFQISARGASSLGQKPAVLCEVDPDEASWRLFGRLDVLGNVYVRIGFPDPSDPDNGDLVLLPNTSDLSSSGIVITDKHGVSAAGTGLACYRPEGGDKQVCRLSTRTREGFSGTLKLQVLAGAITDSSGQVSRASDPLYIAGENWTVSAADATAKRDTDATIDFEVALNARDECRRVTVDWVTADGTATAGQDYRAGSGTLTFEPGETTKTVSVAVLNDTASEGDETFTLRLGNISGHLVEIGAAEATGTIRGDGVEGPTLSSASVDGAELTLTFSKALNESSTPPPSLFAVTVGDSARAVDSVLLSASVPRRSAR